MLYQKNNYLPNHDYYRLHRTALQFNHSHHLDAAARDNDKTAFRNTLRIPK